jgi:hypothetical protein
MKREGVGMRDQDRWEGRERRYLELKRGRFRFVVAIDHRAEIGRMRGREWGKGGAG